MGKPVCWVCGVVDKIERVGKVEDEYDIIKCIGDGKTGKVSAQHTEGRPSSGAGGQLKREGGHVCVCVCSVHVDRLVGFLFLTSF